MRNGKNTKKSHTNKHYDIKEIFFNPSDDMSCALVTDNFAILFLHGSSNRVIGSLQNVCPYKSLKATVDAWWQPLCTDQKGAKYLFIKQISWLSWQNISRTEAITWLKTAITCSLEGVDLWANQTKEVMGVPEVMEVKVNNFLDDFQVFLIILAVTGFPHLIK